MKQVGVFKIIVADMEILLFFVMQQNRRRFNWIVVTKADFTHCHAYFMKERFLVLDIFRGIFASFVVFFHMSPFTESRVLNNHFILNADIFVDFFFVLSGFVIAYSYQSIASSAQFSSFYKKRFYRLYPLHLFMLFTFLVVELSKNVLANYIHVNELHNPDNNQISFFSSLFLLNSVKMPQVNDVSWNIPSWSISAEMISYLVFGGLMLLIHKMGLFRFRVAGYVILLFTCGLIFYRLTGGFRLTYSFDYGFLRGIIGFFCGVICYNAYPSIKQRFSNSPQLYFDVLEPFVLLLVLYLVYNKQKIEDAEYLFLLVFFVAILLFAFERGIVSRSMKKIVLLQTLGKYSYSIYMTHALLISLFNIVFIRVLKFPTSSYSYLFIINYLLVYGVSHFTFKHIEMRFATRKEKPALATAQ